jgi:hypothetical protein
MRDNAWYPSRDGIHYINIDDRITKESQPNYKGFYLYMVDTKLGNHIFYQPPSISTIDNMLRLRLHSWNRGNGNDFVKIYDS